MVSKGIIALIVGIFGLLLFWFPILNLILGTVALLYGIKAIKEESGSHKGMGIVGIVLSSFSLFAGVITLVLIIVAVFGGIPSIGSQSPVASSSTGYIQNDEGKFIDPSNYWRLSEFGIDSGFVKPSGASQLTIRNNQEYTVRLSSIKFGSEEVTLNEVMASGMAKTVSFSSVHNQKYVAGDSFSFPVVIKYSLYDSNDLRTFEGDIEYSGTVANE